MRTGRVVIALLTVSILAFSAYALTAANTVPATNAGQGAGTITTYTVSGARYTLSAASPQLITATTFTINAPSPSEARTVEAKLGSAAYQSCALSSSTSTASTWSCPVPNVSVTSAGSLEVAAAQ